MKWSLELEPVRRTDGRADGRLANGRKEMAQKPQREPTAFSLQPTAYRLDGITPHD